MPKLEELLDQMDNVDEEWEHFDELNVKILPTGDVKLCFVYQSKNIERLYRKYGVQLVLFDVSHKVYKYKMLFIY